MKIAIIVRKLNVKGGAQRQALCLAVELQKLGHRVKIYTFVFSKEDCYLDLLENLDVVSLKDYSAHKNYFFNLKKENRFSKELAFLIDKDTEVLNPHDQVSYKVAVYFKKKIKNIPSVWMMNDMPTKTWSFWRDVQFDSDVKASIFKRIIYWLVDFYDYFRFIKYQDKIVVLDNRDKDWVKKYFKKDAKVVRSGFDADSMDFVERELKRGEPINMLMAGIFFPHRRFEDGIMAVDFLRKKNIDVHLIVVGAYENSRKYFNKLNDLVKRLNLSGMIDFVGRISDAEFKNYFRKSDIFVFPSHLQSWGLVVFEAMARGLPAIVSKTAGASEVLTDHENAIIVEPRDPEGIARAALELIEKPELYKKLSTNGRKFVEENISWRRYAEEMLRLFKEEIK